MIDFLSVKISAFTLIDILSATVVSGILLGATFYFFFYVKESQIGLHKSTRYSYDIESFYERVNKSIFESDLVTIIDGRIMFYNPKSIASLRVEEEMLIFERGLKDTLNCSSIDFEADYKNESKAVNLIKLQFRLEELDFKWCFEKQYGVQLKVNNWE